MVTETTQNTSAPVTNGQQQQSLNTKAARNLAVTTNTVPQMTGITPKYLLHLLPWVQVQCPDSDGRAKIDLQKPD